MFSCFTFKEETPVIFSLLATKKYFYFLRLYIVYRDVNIYRTFFTYSYSMYFFIAIVLQVEAVLKLMRTRDPVLFTPGFGTGLLD